jgi:hypothetical protein
VTAESEGRAVAALAPFPAGEAHPLSQAAMSETADAPGYAERNPRAAAMSATAGRPDSHSGTLHSGHSAAVESGHVAA